MKKYFVFAVNKYDFTYDTVCYSYDEALTWLNQLFEESKSFYPLRAVIMNYRMNVIFERFESGEKD